jgi:hypothetical protein
MPAWPWLLSVGKLTSSLRVSTAAFDPKPTLNRACENQVTHVNERSQA